MAECHPVGFQWVMEAKARGAKIIHIDPRFTRTSAIADLHVPLRVGTDIAFLGGLIKYVLDNDLYFKEYVVAYTNAAALVGEDFVDTEDLDGLFSGFDPEKRQYDQDSWQYEPEEPRHSAAPRTAGRGRRAGARRRRPGRSRTPTGRRPPAAAARRSRPSRKRDETLQHPRCVFQVLKRHFARYTPEMVAEVCGIEPEVFEQVAEWVTANSNRDRTTAWVYSVGWTQHSVGAQYIRTGVDPADAAGQHRPPRRRDHGAARARQHPGLHRHPDAVQPAARLPADAARRTSTRRWTTTCADAAGKAGFWGNKRAYMVSLLKAWWGDAATAGERLLLRLPAQDQRRPQLLPDDRAT